ncbi:MAG TPA: hypothetical protein VHG69_01860 [Thermoleophilaceae bacterium]|nr:hypothetical protein [Thermoleophilaceae bacterium]
MESEVRGLSPAEAPRAAAALAAAFQDDPVMSWCFPRPARRAAALRLGFELLLRRIWLEHDQCFTNEEVAAAACWLATAGPSRARASRPTGAASSAAS